jgi:hypothetical protein
MKCNEWKIKNAKLLMILLIVIQQKRFSFFSTKSKITIILNRDNVIIDHLLK